MDKQKMLQAIFGEATLGILMVNKDGVIIEANPFVEKLFGYEPGELLQQKIEVLVPTSAQVQHVQHRKKYHQHPKRRLMGANLNLYGQRKDGSQFPVEISLSYLEVDQERLAIAYVKDDTIQRNFTKSLKENQEFLEKKVADRTRELAANELRLKAALKKEQELGELKSRFVSMASHEFRTPLSSILSSADLIGMYQKEEQQSKRIKHVHRIISSVTNLITILNDFLSLEKLESGHVQYHPISIDFLTFVQGVLEEMNIANQDHQVIHEHTGGSTTIKADEHLLKNILINLLSNAIKYSPHDKVIKLLTHQENGYFNIAVKDHGIGIPKTDQPHMFTRFFRANNVENIQGTGLGLTIVKRYLDLMGGHISFESEENVGTTFKIDIPQ